MSQANAEEALIKKFPYEIHQVRGPSGELVWVQRGINPDNIFEDKRRTDWPYSLVVADQICVRISEGATLSKICMETGFPPYNVVCRWRRENVDFAEALAMAYEDRVEFYRDKICSIIEELDVGGCVQALRVKFNALKWCMGEKAGPKKKSSEQNFSIIVTS